MFEAALDPVHRSARATVWRRGVDLARGGVVELLECTSRGWLFRVEEARVVWTWQAWRCDCATSSPRSGPCAHIVAAACTLHAAGRLIAHAPAVMRSSARTAYRLVSRVRGVALEVVERTTTPTGEAAEMVYGGDPEADDPLVAAMPPGESALILTADNLEAVLAELAQAFEVSLDGAPVLVDPEALAVAAEPTPRELAAAGVTRLLLPLPLALCGDTLRRLAASERRVGEPPMLEPPPPTGPPTEPPPTEPPVQAPPLVGPPEDERPTLAPRWHHDEVDGPEITFEAPGAGGRPIEVPAGQVVRAWRSGTLALESDEGETVWLPQDWLQRYGPILEQFAAARDASGALPRWARPIAAELCVALDAPPPPELERLTALARDASELPAAELPAGFRGELRDYQRRGVDWLCLLRDAGIGALLADDMGLGKTLQTLCALRGRTLVVAPTSTLHNWAAELARFRPDLRVRTFHGPGRALDEAEGVTLTNYALLRVDRELLAAAQWDIVVLDEAQAIKEPTTATAAAAFALPARWRVALTGTPVENRLTELWSLAHFLNPGLLGGRRDFLARHVRPIDQGHARAAAELQRRLRPFVLRRRKTEVARELPARTEVVLRCTLDAHEREVYDSLRAAVHDDLLRRVASGGSVIEALELLLRLRQAACHLGLVPGQTAPRSSKVDLLLEQLGQACAAGHRCLVFSQWTGLLDLVEAPLAAAGLAFVRLDGATEDRAAVVARFQAPDGPPVMLVSLRAGGTGINLTAADHVYLLDPWYNPAVEDQAADRAHRIGQTRPVFVHRLIAEDTVESRILELHEHKRALADLATGDAQVASLARDDLLALLRP